MIRSFKHRVRVCSGQVSGLSSVDGNFGSLDLLKWSCHDMIALLDMMSSKSARELELFELR